MILYHGTTRKHVDAIRREGLRMHREIPDEPTLPARVCLTDIYDEAREWGDGTVVTVSVPDHWPHKKGYQDMGEFQVHHNIPPYMIVGIMFHDTPPDATAGVNTQ